MVVPLSAVTPVAPTSYLDTTMQTAGVSTSGSDFGATLAGAVDNLQQLQSTSNDLAVKAVTGDLNDIHQATIAATRAQVTMEVVAAVRNKGIEAFNDIMRMQA
ncbi:MAG: flagellar hook-basal body complex protein FliE [Micrococcales bacterium 70-64]|nr:flagellar hook-basal body complex protein FliE [Leifsonia sp.]ODU64084.1 MAG: flagellar hook-basal body complex protein FliE [Leifsonia sp. SCN 70-46]OJX85775.1 MAG: flagellar hook-basal body complex protein FliE [Micrococcales bacterium 70-64]